MKIRVHNDKIEQKEERVIAFYPLHPMIESGMKIATIIMSAIVILFFILY